MQPLFTPEVVSLIDTLGEYNRIARTRIARIIAAIGLDLARELLREAHAIEANGGMLTLDGTRRRTFGGVWIRLAKERMTDEQWIAVFGYPRGTPRPRSMPAPPAEPPWTWADRRSFVAEAAEEKGDTHKMKVQLIGRPKKIVQRADCALLMMQDRSPLPALPSGIPVPSKVPTTDYIIWIGAKQWKKVREAIRQPDDVLIVDGVQIYDQEFGAIAAFATNVTTKLIQRQQREAQQQARG